MVRRSLSVDPLEGSRGVAEPVSRAAESACGGEERQAEPEDHGDDEGEEKLGPVHGFPRPLSWPRGPRMATHPSNGAPQRMMDR
jgi:hypothetical protein